MRFQAAKVVKLSLAAFFVVFYAGCGTGAPVGGDDWTVSDIGSDTGFDAVQDSSFDGPGMDSLNSNDMAADGGDAGDTAGFDDAVVDAAPGEFVVTGLEPESGDSTGTTTVTILGRGLDDAVEVWFGHTRSPSVFPLSSTLLNCVAPPGGAGPVRVRVIDSHGRRAVSPVDFLYHAELSVSAVEPLSGPASGGTPVQVTGSGFLGAPEVYVGGRPVISVTVADDSHLLIVTPPGAAGKADVRVVLESDEAVLDDGWEYDHDDIAPTLPGVVIEHVSPASGPSSGGSLVTITGDGFFEGMGVRIGALPCPSVRFISDTAIEVRTPPGSPGKSDVVVFYRYAEVRLDGGFFYLGPDGGTMGVFEMDPPEAAWGGGSLVTIRGFGLGGADQAWFGAYDAEVVEKTSDFEMTVRSPRAGETGKVFVMVAGDGAAMLDDAFRFYDPYIYGGGVTGRRIDRNLNVTVFNGSTLERVPGAWVVVGADMHTSWQGRTDDRGQITFSAKDMAGPLAVSATLETFTANTISGFNAQDVTLGIYSSPSPESPTEGQPSEPSTSCTLSGRVTDYGKYFLKPAWLDGTAWVECFNSTSSMYTSMSTIPESNRPDEDGRFSIPARGGEFAVICRLMVREAGAQEGYPLRMGIRRHLKCVDGVVPEALVSLDIPTESSVRFGVSDVPWHQLGVYEPRFTGGWHLGSDGYIPLPSRGTWDGGVETFQHQPVDFGGDGETDLAGSGFDLYVTISSRDSSGLPYSVVQVSGVEPSDGGALLSGAPDSLHVSPTSISGSFRSFTKVADGSILAVDDTGRTWVYGDDGLVAGPVALHTRINDLVGDSYQDFTAVASGGRIIEVVGGVATTVSTPFIADLLAIDRDSSGGQSIVAGTFLLNRENGVISVEDSPPGARMSAVRRFDDGTVFAIGPDGVIVTGRVGEEMAAVTAAAEDLLAVEGDSPSRVWVAGENGRVILISDGDVSVMKTPGAATLRGILVLGDCDVIFYGDSGSLYRYDCFQFTDLSDGVPAKYALSGGAVTDAGAGEIALISAPVMDLIGFAGFPTISSPVDGTVWNRADISWASGVSWGATHCQGLISGITGNVFWQFTTDGVSGRVVLPDFSRAIGYDPIVPGPKRVNVTCSRSPLFDMDNYDYRSLYSNYRETFSVDLASFY